MENNGLGTMDGKQWSRDNGWNAMVERRWMEHNVHTVQFGQWNGKVLRCCVHGTGDLRAVDLRHRTGQLGSSAGMKRVIVHTFSTGDVAQSLEHQN